MSSALLTILLLAANPSSGCCAAIDPSDSSHSFSERWLPGLHYHKRLYYGHFDRHPFDYRFQFDYPWQAGPSQSRWPISPLPTTDLESWHEVQAAKGRSISSPRLSSTSSPAHPEGKPSTARSSLTFRR